MNQDFSNDECEDLAKQMHMAVAELDFAKVTELLARGVPADVWDIDDENCDHPLQAVARRDGEQALSIAKALIEAGADIDFQGDFGCTALARSIETNWGSNRDNWAMARLMIKAGANPSLWDRDRFSPAETANCDGNNGAVLAMIEAGMDPNVIGGAGPLLWYCAWDDEELVQILLANGADPNVEAETIEGRQTALQRAVESFELGGDEPTFRNIAIQLIQAGADLSQIDQAPECLSDFLLARQEREVLAELPIGRVVERMRVGL